MFDIKSYWLHKKFSNTFHNVKVTKNNKLYDFKDRNQQNYQNIKEDVVLSNGGTHIIEKGTLIKGGSFPVLDQIF